MKKSILFVILLFSIAAPTALAVEFTVPQSERRVANEPSVSSAGNVIELRSNGSGTVRFEIFSITGQLIKSVNVKSVSRIELPKGFYIVKCDAWTKRVVVK